MKYFPKTNVLKDMKSFFVSIIVVFAATSVLATNELDLELNKFYQKNNVQINNKTVDDYTLIRRLYIDIAGRIPNTEEIKAFITAKFPNKKQLMVEKLIYSEDYVNNFYNFWADILRIRPDRLGDGIQMKSYPYMEYVRNFIRSDRPYNQFVTELLTATGKITDNPASSYLIRDDGMALDNLAITMKIFIAQDRSCSVCHDNPFSSDTQMEFYRILAFFNQNNRENRKDYAEVQKRIDKEIKEITKTDRIDNNIRQILGANLFNIQPDQNKQIKLPHDYKYEDGKPNQIIQANTPDGKVKAQNELDRRLIFAQWLTQHDNFKYAITNRIWENIVGRSLTYPLNVSNFNINEIKNKEILVFLGEYFKQHNYSIRSLVQLIINSDFYSKSAYNKSMEEYNLQAILIKRLDSFKIWDSILSLIVKDPNYSKINYKEYSDLFDINFASVSGASLIKQKDDLRNYEQSINNNFLKYQGVELVRSCFFNKNSGFNYQFLQEFGASDRILIDSSDEQGSITQILTLMNSNLIEIICSDKSELMNSFNQNKNKESIFLSVLSRPPTIFQKDIVNSAPIKDLIWVLINTREFLFRN